VILRAIGPSLTAFGVDNAISDPQMTLFDGNGHAIASNNDWKESQQQEIEGSKLPPNSDLEAAIVTTLPVGAYTAIVSGVNNATGVGLVEVFDLDQASPARLANISTRGQVGTGSDVMIAGFIVGGSEPAAMVVRGIGPSLLAAGIAAPIENPTLELHLSGNNVVPNDNWRAAEENQLIGAALPPNEDVEPAIFTTLAPGAYTAILRGNDDTTGVGLVEVYDLE